MPSVKIQQATVLIVTLLTVCSIGAVTPINGAAATAESSEPSGAFQTDPGKTTTIVLMPFKLEIGESEVSDNLGIAKLRVQLGEAVIARFVRIPNTKIINLAASPQDNRNVEGDHFITGRIAIQNGRLDINARIFDRTAKKIIWTAEAQEKTGQNREAVIAQIADRLGHYYQPPEPKGGPGKLPLYPFASVNLAGGFYAALGGGLFYKNFIIDAQFGTYGLDTGSETQINILLRFSAGYHYPVIDDWAVGLEGLFLLYRTTRLSADFSYPVYGAALGATYKPLNAVQIFTYYSPLVGDGELDHRIGLSTRYIFF